MPYYVGDVKGDPNFERTTHVCVSLCVCVCACDAWLLKPGLHDNAPGSEHGLWRVVSGL